jgi:hypothetical protein
MNIDYKGSPHGRPCGQDRNQTSRSQRQYCRSLRPILLPRNLAMSSLPSPPARSDRRHCGGGVNRPACTARALASAEATNNARQAEYQGTHLKSLRFRLD